jgi:hypothetical protein
MLTMVFMLSTFGKYNYISFAAFTFNFQVSQYKYIALRADCNSAAVSANITVTSAYSNKYNLKYISISSLSNNKC